MTGETMFASVDFNGLGVLIAAIFSGLAALIAAWNNRVGRDVQRQVTTNGDPRTLGEIATDVGKAVAPKEGTDATSTVTPNEPKP